MKRAFIYQDEKSHKFWSIDYSGIDFAVNYGKYGTIGKYEVKEHDSNIECQQEAEKLIRQKLKKGYVESTDFDFENRIYIDDQNIGPHPKTSHPAFVEHFTESFYYDCGDEEAPFGSDEGSDTLDILSEIIRKNPRLDFLAFPQKLIEEEWGMEYIPADTVTRQDIDNLMNVKEMDMTQSDMVTYATAFAQIKLTGKVDRQLKEQAINALERLKIAWEIETSEMIDKMIEDLSSFAK
ncbi:WGR domain-containing protein [Bacillus sp. FJAT-42315]|uniref:WGR domain-containing protein n=1 Tax=Bacillus sp. FJAT-42315 TaxID=2014077 RepID=UPI000C2368E4|nr:WGR domain-containing protein [Bacillus sp. FJAT-42315]